MNINYSTTYYNISFRGNSNGGLAILTVPSTPSGNNTIEIGKWVHVAATVDSNGYKIYLNGILKGSLSQAPPNANLNSKLYFGRYHSSSNADARHVGNLGDMRFYKGALTADQVAQNYLATKSKYQDK